MTCRKYRSQILNRLLTVLEVLAHPAWKFLGAALSAVWIYTQSDFITSWRLETSRQMNFAQALKRRGYDEFSRNHTALGHYFYGQAAAIYKNLIDLGYSQAGYELGKLVCVGWGIEKNPELALDYWRRADLNAAQRERILQIIDFQKCWKA
jgi:hypothetical protein